MRLSSITTSLPLIVRVVAFFSKREFGKVLSPLRVIYARKPGLLKIVMKMIAVEKGFSLPLAQRLLIRNFVSALNDCKFCANAASFAAQKENLEFVKVKSLMNFRHEDLFSAKDKAILSYCEEVTTTKTCSDECFATLKEHFSEVEIIEITWINASENYFNLQAKPLGLTSDDLRYPLSAD